jgi:hypothetical protein
MRGFLIQHIDALISIGFGIGLTLYSWVRRDRLQSSSKKIVRALPVLAPLVLVFGVLRLAFDSQPAFEWRRITTSDQRASAEFPCATSTSKATDSAQGVSIQRLTIDCNIPRRDINLRLTYNEIPPEGAGLSVEQRLDGLKNFFQQQGLAIISNVPDPHGDIPGFRILVEKDQGKSRSLMRVALATNAIYRVIATSTAGFHDDPAITRFIDSFTMK